MSSSEPSVPIITQIKKIIFEKYNNPELKFTNDEIFEILKENGDINPSWIVDDIESFFKEICDSGLTRNIAQNFTTFWL